VSECISKDYLDIDGNVRLVAIDRANLFANGRWLVVRDGVRGVGLLRGGVVTGIPKGAGFPGIPLADRQYSFLPSDFGLQDAYIILREMRLSELGHDQVPTIAQIYAEAMQRFPTK
jgi:hypothetical protein